MNRTGSTLRRRVALIAAASLLWPLRAAQAQSGAWPQRPVRLVVPFAAAGTTDLLARLISDPLARELGQGVVVDNRPGAGGSLGTELVAHANADGYTIGMVTQSTHAANPALNPALPYDPLADFEPIGMVCVMPGVLVVHPDLPVRTMAELLDHVRRHPGQLSYGTPGVGSLGHLLMLQFEELHGLRLVHVPYRGGGALLADALAGRLQVVGDNLMSALPYIREGRLRALGVMATRRVAPLPDVPTYAELGFGRIGQPAWFGLAAPARTPPAVLARLRGALQAVLRQPDVVAALARSGSEPAAGSAEDFASAIRTTLQEFRAVVVARNLKPE